MCRAAGAKAASMFFNVTGGSPPPLGDRLFQEKLWFQIYAALSGRISLLTLMFFKIASTIPVWSLGGHDLLGDLWKMEAEDGRGDGRRKDPWFLEKRPGNKFPEL